MLTRDRTPRNDRALPTFITLVVLGVLLMTFHVRLAGGGVVGVMRTGAQTIVAPMQKAAAFVVNPIADAIDSLGNISGLREENSALQAALEDKEAQLIAVQSQLARLELFEELYGLNTAGTDIGRTVANVIGRPAQFDAGLIIDRGTNHGIAVGQPVIDTRGYVVGTVSSVTAISATIVPITASREGVRVLVGTQIGRLTSQINSDDMRLEIPDAREPVFAGDRIVTSAASVSFPAGLPVGEVLVDAAVETASISTLAMPYMNVDNLQIVVVLAWPADPVSAAGQDPIPEVTTTTTSGSGTSTTGATTTTIGGG
jgi:rod shape-determining protein MreC